MQTLSVDRELKNYITKKFGVKKRTLQRWMKASVVPGVYRTKGGHYRIRKPKGMTPDKLNTFVASRIILNQNFDVGEMEWLGVAALADNVKAGPEFVTWVLKLERNVRDYALLMRPIWQHERNGGTKVPFYTLDELKKLAAEGARRMREATSSTTSSSDFSLETFEPMGENPLERVQ